MEQIASIGKFFSSPAGSGVKDIATLGSAGAGLYGNISAERQRAQELNNLKAQQANAERTPQQLAADVASAERPLDKALVQSVGNQVSGTLAEQGLSQAPGIQAQALAQGLAPFQQQNQQAALQLVLKRLGLPVEYAQTLLAGNPAPADLSKLLALLGRPSGGTSAGGLDMAQLQKLLNQNSGGEATPATADWSRSYSASAPATPPDPGLPDWLQTASPTAPAWGG
jgi:hypothetical protein